MTNGAAERLHKALGMYGGEYRRLLAEALEDERRATVKRLRERLSEAVPRLRAMDSGMGGDIDRLRAILDEEAAA